MRIGKILDVVEAPDVIGKAMHALGTTPVPHIVVPDGDTVHWLLPRGAANRRPWPWARISRYVKVLPNVAEFGVPGAGLTDGFGPHWAYPDGWDGGHIADEWLTEDLAVCTLAHLGPPAQRCELCPKPLWPEDGVRVVRPRGPFRNPSSNTIRVHTQCARTQGLT
ncbi:hypothetical protein OHS81_14935 [Streptomyces sp. NBC_00400]|uniref:hypothetical protein n=1 Tax=Streptomyces sp. NBC_00400 TaxID=2975737 RepID=UPI002E1EB69F